MRKAMKANGLQDGLISLKLSRTETMPDINTEKVCFIIIKARELECEDEGVEADASNAADDTVFCSNRHRLPLLARARSRYVPRSALFYQGNRNERADCLDLAR